MFFINEVEGIDASGWECVSYTKYIYCTSIYHCVLHCDIRVRNRSYTLSQLFKGDNEWIEGRSVQPQFSMPSIATLELSGSSEAFYNQQ